MSRSAADYTAMLQSLLPSGRAWSRDPDALLTQLLAAKANGLAAIDAAADVVVSEADPRTTVQLLPVWERNFGLPLPGAQLAPDIPARQQAVVQQMTLQPGQSRPWWLALAAGLGFPDADVIEHRPFRAGASVAGDPVASGTWRFAWTLMVYAADGSPQAATLRALVARYAAGETFATVLFGARNPELFSWDFTADPTLFDYDFLGGA